MISNVRFDLIRLSHWTISVRSHFTWSCFTGVKKTHFIQFWTSTIIAFILRYEFEVQTSEVPNISWPRVWVSRSGLLTRKRKGATFKREFILDKNLSLVSPFWKTEHFWTERLPRTHSFKVVWSANRKRGKYLYVFKNIFKHACLKEEKRYHQLSPSTRSAKSKFDKFGMLYHHTWMEDLS